MWYPTSGCNRPFTVLVLKDPGTPGLLVAYSHKFHIQTQSSWIYFVNSPAAYCCGLLASFILSALTQRDQPTHFCLVAFILTACLLAALLYQELKALWTYSDFTKHCSYPPSEISISYPDAQKDPDAQMWLKEVEEYIINHIPNKDQLDNLCWKKEFTNTNIHIEEKNLILPKEKPSTKHDWSWIKSWTVEVDRHQRRSKNSRGTSSNQPCTMGSFPDNLSGKWL